MSSISLCVVELRICASCKQELALSEFYSYVRGDNRKRYYQSYCKSCTLADQKRRKQANPARHKESNRRWVLKSKYGITLEQYESMLAAQGGVCATCKGPATRNRVFDVDHCHKSGVVRGLLCNRCNMVVGLLGDDPAVAQRIVSYLNESLVD